MHIANRAGLTQPDRLQMQIHLASVRAALALNGSHCYSLFCPGHGCWPPCLGPYAAGEAPAALPVCHESQGAWAHVSAAPKGPLQAAKDLLHHGHSVQQAALPANACPSSAAAVASELVSVMYPAAIHYQAVAQPAAYPETVEPA